MMLMVDISGSGKFGSKANLKDIVTGLPPPWLFSNSK
jgi:hypothetical protein